MDAFLSETHSDDATPIAFNRVAGVVVVGNEDGAHHLIAEIGGALIDIGYTIPGQAWTYWNKGPGPGDEEWLTTNEREWSITTGQTAACNPPRGRARSAGARDPDATSELRPRRAERCRGVQPGCSASCSPLDRFMAPVVPRPSRCVRISAISRCWAVSSLRLACSTAPERCIGGDRHEQLTAELTAAVSRLVRS